MGVEKATNGQRFKFLLEVGTLLFMIGIAWASLRGIVVQNEQQINKMESRVLLNEAIIVGIRISLKEIQVSQEYMSKGINEIKEKLGK